jgi:hypothetical protein
MSFLYTNKRKQLRVIGTSISDLYKIAQVLDIDTKDPPDVICQKIKKKAPDVEWQIQNNLDISKFDADIKESGWEKPILNPYIGRLQELEKEIIVLRRIRKN